MPSEYRLIAILCFGAVILTTLGTGAFFGSLYAPDKSHYRTIPADGSQTYPRNAPKNGLADISGIDGFAERAIAQPQPRNPDERQNRDLAAQEAVAVFSYWGFWGIVLQTMLAGGALLALIFDLRQNRSTAQAQMRAYIRFEPQGGDFKVDEKVVFKFLIIDYGQTPAFEGALESSMVIRPKGWRWDDEPKKIQNSKERPSFTIHPNDPFTAEFGMDKPIPRKVFQAVRSGDSVLYGAGIFYYTDAFGMKHQTETRVEFSGPDCFRTGLLRIANAGNAAT